MLDVGWWMVDGGWWIPEVSIVNCQDPSSMAYPASRTLQPRRRRQSLRWRWVALLRGGVRDSAGTKRDCHVRVNRPLALAQSNYWVGRFRSAHLNRVRLRDLRRALRSSARRRRRLAVNRQR